MNSSSFMLPHAQEILHPPMAYLHQKRWSYKIWKYLNDIIKYK